MMWIAGVSPLARVRGLRGGGRRAGDLRHSRGASSSTRYSPIMQATPHERVRVDWVAGRHRRAHPASRDRRQRRRSTCAFNDLSDRFPFIGAAVWVAILVSMPLRRPDWEVLPEAFKGSDLPAVAGDLRVDDAGAKRCPAASWQSRAGPRLRVGGVRQHSADGAGAKQGGYDWGFLAYAVGFGGSMIWFGSSAGVALSNQFPEARSAVAWLRGGWHVAVAYVCRLCFRARLAPDRSTGAFDAPADMSMRSHGRRRCVATRPLDRTGNVSGAPQGVAMTLAQSAAIAAGCCGTAAQEIVLYQGENFSGRRFSANNSVERPRARRLQRPRVVGDDPRRIVAALLRQLLPRRNA